MSTIRRRRVLRAVLRLNAIPIERLAWPAALASLLFLAIVAFVIYCHGVMPHG